MKKRFLFLILSVVILFFSGCSSDNFFDIQNSMKPPALSEENQKIKNVLEDYLNTDMVWNYCSVNGRYCVIIESKFSDTQENYKMAFCKTAGEASKVHILFLKPWEDSWKVFYEISDGIISIEKIYIKDINEDGENEIIISVREEESLRIKTYVYSCGFDQVKELKISGKLNI